MLAAFVEEHQLSTEQITRLKQILDGKDPSVKTGHTGKEAHGLAHVSHRILDDCDGNDELEATYDRKRACGVTILFFRAQHVGRLQGRRSRLPGGVLKYSEDKRDREERSGRSTGPLRTESL